MHMLSIGLIISNRDNVMAFLCTFETGWFSNMYQSIKELNKSRVTGITHIYRQLKSHRRCPPSQHM